MLKKKNLSSKKKGANFKTQWETKKIDKRVLLQSLTCLRVCFNASRNRDRSMVSMVTCYIFIFEDVIKISHLSGSNSQYNIVPM